mmetsp:Transcript_31302/g.52192  ORF Transcript_31302/g.52192 Transcript_31302/m.52192 type:complete len:304 (+) Transcript_31302:8-919(+)
MVWLHRSCNIALFWSFVLLSLAPAPSTCTSVDNGDRECRNDASLQPGWDPNDDHPCTIEHLSMQDFEAEYGPNGGLPPFFPRPLVIRAEKARNVRFRDLTRFDSIQQSFPSNYSVTLSSSNSFSEHRRTIPFSQYLYEVASQWTSPDQKSNETWYFFGETFSPEWEKLLQTYEIPPCQACKNRELVALAFGIGNSGSGVQWHVHGPGFSEAVHGRKHWILARSKPNFDPDQTSFNWMYYDWATITNENKDRFLECTLHEGDMLYFPDGWWHATINLDSYTAFISSFVQEHLFAKESAARMKLH